MNNTYTREQVIDAMERAWIAGMRQGIKRFAWWKDSNQYVGTCGTLLKDALDNTSDYKNIMFVDFNSILKDNDNV